MFLQPLPLGIYTFLLCLYIYGIWNAEEKSPRDSDAIPVGEKEFAWIIQAMGLLWFLSLLLPYFTPPLQMLPSTWALSIGVTISLFGTWFRAFAIRSLGDEFTYVLCIREQHTLHQEGVYAYIRHPSYTGTFLEVIGMMIAVRSLWGLLLFLLGAGLMIGIRVEREERMLLEHFGPAYAEYMKRTKRFVPWLF